MMNHIKELEKLLKQEEIEKTNNPWKTVVLYAIFGFLWILFSDKFLDILNFDHKTYSLIQTYKGSFYVLLTSLMLYFLIKLDYSKIFKLNKSISDKNQELISYSEELVAMDEELKGKIDAINSVTDELLDQKRFVDEIFESSNLIIMIWKLDGRIIEVNKYFTELLGYSFEEVRGKKWYEKLLVDEEEYIVFDLIEQLRYGKKVTNLEKHIVSSSGQVLTILWNDSIIVNPVTKESVAVSFGIDITKEKQQEQELFQVANRDKLTGLKNRLVLEKDINELIRKNQSFTAYFLDIDNFKNLNNLYGHKIGDAYLRNLANQLECRFKGSKVYRWCGDEFLMIEDSVDRSQINDTVGKLMRFSDELISVDDIELNTTLSVGITRYPTDGGDLMTILKNIDIALYKAKENGKSRYEFYDEELQGKIEFHSRIENALNHAILNDEFELLFQPIYRLDNLEVFGFETLIRWDVKDLGQINTGEFISIAEKTGQIVKIDKWVIKKVFSLIKERCHAYKDCKLSVNISAQSFNSEGFLDYISNMVKEYDIDTSIIDIEITEHSYINDLNGAVKIMNSIKDLGFNISLDDFGTMYSSINYLAKLPIDIVKIDKTYIDNILYIANDKIIVEQIIQLSRKLDLQIIAEGIEHKEQLDLLNELSCNYGQGYYMSKPISFEAALNLIKNKLDI